MAHFRSLLISIVSHGQGDLVKNLLADLADTCWSGGVDFEVVITLNIPEDEAWLDQDFPFCVHVIRNDRPRGFGANHNTAFTVVNSDVYVVANPDIRLDGFQLAHLMNALDQPTTGVCGPRVVGPDGVLQDSARRFPTIRRQLSRVLLRQRRPDFNDEGDTILVDWLAGMFLIFPSKIFLEIQGFDERYFMYMEDVEICRYLRRQGFQALWVGGATVIHDAQRASGRSTRRLRWHLASMFRYFCQRQRSL